MVKEKNIIETQKKRNNYYFIKNINSNYGNYNENDMRHLSMLFDRWQHGP